MSSFRIRFAVGLPGEQMYTSFMEGVDDNTSLMASGRRRKLLEVSRGTLTMLMSFICALTEYMPYVGGQVRIWSCPGVQKQRRRASMTSSEPTPTKSLSGVKVFCV